MNVSVIIPNYCHARFLNQRIDSVLNQTYSDYEVIILDDCSTDNSREIIESYRNHPKISHIVYNEKNSGSTFIQWEKGFELARGEYIWIAESDDVARSTFLEECMNAFSSYSDVSIVFSDCLFVDENTRDMHETKLQLTYRLSDKKQDSPYTSFFYRPPHVLPELYHERQHGGIPKKQPTPRQSIHELSLRGRLAFLGRYPAQREHGIYRQTTQPFPSTCGKYHRNVVFFGK